VHGRPWRQIPVRRQQRKQGWDNRGEHFEMVLAFSMPAARAVTSCGFVVVRASGIRGGMMRQRPEILTMRTTKTGGSGLGGRESRTGSGGD
jgi:hypothetical protein